MSGHLNPCSCCRAAPRRGTPGTYKSTVYGTGGGEITASRVPGQQKATVLTGMRTDTQSKKAAKNDFRVCRVGTTWATTRTASDGGGGNPPRGKIALGRSDAAGTLFDSRYNAASAQGDGQHDFTLSGRRARCRQHDGILTNTSTVCGPDVVPAQTPAGGMDPHNTRTEADGPVGTI